MVFECLDNCGKCCQPIILAEGYWEWVAASAVCPYEEVWYEHNGEKWVVPRRLDGSGKCVFLDENMRCVIYNDRPQVCKEYGVKTKCPYVDEEGNPRSAVESQDIAATVCMQYALAATLMPPGHEDIVDRLLQLDSLAFYEAAFVHGVRIEACMRKCDDGTTKVEIGEELFPVLREYLARMGIRLEV